jgi:hypothetical protein
MGNAASWMLNPSRVSMLPGLFSGGFGAEGAFEGVEPDWLTQTKRESARAHTEGKERKGGFA